MLKSYRHTKAACYIGYITQAIVANLFPLLLLVFHGEFGISLSRLTVLITVNFAMQLCVDALASRFADKIGYRVCFVAAHFFAAAGLAGLALLPMLFGNAYAGLVVASVLYAVGGGLIEVLVSPAIEACPSENKKGQMSLLHSFYCWGSAAVVLLTTVYFWGFGTQNWRILAGIWAVIPFANALYFLFVPIPDMAGEENVSFGGLFKQKKFWLFAALMALAGASELAMGQWASAFAESGLGVSKTTGDLIGPCLFAVFMGIARLLYARFGKRLRLCMILSGGLCIICYLLVWLSPLPWLALAGCALCGFSVGILWPSTLSLAAAEIPKGGTAMFGMLAMAGDIGCTSGPTLVGLCAGAFGDDIGTGIAFALAFPVLFVLLLICSSRKKKKNRLPECGFSEENQ